MALDPGDRVLEIGCGRGLAAWLVCRQLTTGRLTAIDRSAAMITQAKRRNAEHIASGRAEFLAAAVDATGLPPRSFDKVFAVNVSLFWMAAAPGEIEAVRHLLAPSGRLYIFHETAGLSRAETISTQTCATLARHGFTTTTRQLTSRPALPLSCVEAT